MTDIRDYLKVVPSAASAGAVNMTNAQFLTELYRFAPVDHKRWTLSTNQARPEWTGKIGEPAPENPERDNYCSVATFNPEARARSSEYFAAAHVVVLDDIDPNVLALPPSYILETSPDNYQCGYLLTVPVTDQQRYNRLMRVLTRMGYGQDRSGNNTVRVVRLPVGTNSKRVHANADGEYPRCRLLQFDTNVRYPFEKLERTWVAGAEDDLPTNGEVVGMGDAEFEGLLEEISKGRDLHENINRAAARMISRGANPFDVKATLRQFMNVTPPEQRDARWTERYDDIERSVRTAYEKFAPATRVDQRVGGETSGKIRLIGFDLAAPLSASPTLIQNYLPLGELTMVWGPPASLKSFITIDWACCVATGRPWLGNKTKQGRVWYLANEGVSTLNQRIRAWLQGQRLTPDEYSIVLAALTKNLVMPDRTLVLNVARGYDNPDVRTLLEYATEDPPVLFVVDTVSRAIEGNENDQETVNNFLRGAELIAQRALDVAGGRCTPLLVHHARKDGETFRGSSVFRGNIYAEYEVSRPEGQLRAGLRCLKMKDGAEPPALGLKFKVEELGSAEDNHGDIQRVSSLVIEGQTLVQETQQRDAEVVKPIVLSVEGLNRVLGSIRREENQQHIDGEVYVAPVRLNDYAITDSKPKSEVRRAILEVLREKGCLEIVPRPDAWVSTRGSKPETVYRVLQTTDLTLDANLFALANEQQLTVRVDGVDVPVELKNE
jgi:hypothetical protein